MTDRRRVDRCMISNNIYSESENEQDFDYGFLGLITYTDNRLDC